VGTGWKRVRRFFLIFAAAILAPYAYLDSFVSRVVGSGSWKWSAGILATAWGLVGLYELAVTIYSKFGPSRIDESRYTSVLPKE